MKKIYLFVFSFIFLLCGVGIVAPNISFSKAEESLVKDISSAEEFVSVMGEAETYNNENVVINLRGNIDLSEQELEYISTANSNNLVFKGTFEGNGFSVSNITINGTGNEVYYGLIPNAFNAVVQNVKISGKIDYQFAELNSKELFVGLIVGRGRNVKFLNCELENRSNEENNQIYLPVYSNVNFGFLAGQIVNDMPVSGNVNIENCVNYYNVNINMKNNSTVFAGGLVGTIKDGFFLNNINNGSLNLSNSLESVDGKNIFIGGIAGGVYGSNTNIRNGIFGGEILNNNSILDVNRGAIIGGKTGSINPLNINFCYYSDLNLKPSGDKTLTAGDYLKGEANINKDFMTNNANFDLALKMWDFDQTFMLVNSGFHLQNFQTFNFTFQQLLDKSQYLSSARFVTDEELTRLSARFGDDVKIKIMLKPQYYGFYQLKNNGVLKNNNQLTASYAVEEILQDNQIVGYYITFKANDLTSGTYSFDINAKEFKCIVTISNEAKAEKQGGILVDSGSSLSENDVEITFSKMTKERKVVAEGIDIFVFDRWELFTKDENGNFTRMVLFDNDQDSALNITFGEEPFDREFKLVAYFTKNAVYVDFGQYKTSMVKSITFGGKVYEGEPLAVSPSSSPSLVVVLEKDYVLDIDAFTRDIKGIYGNNSTQSLVTAQPEKNEEDGTTTYRFSINMRYVQEFDNNSLKLSFLIEKDSSGSITKLLWLYILLPSVVVIAVVVVIIIVLKRRRGGSSGGGNAGKVKEKKVSYKDYY